MPKNTEIRTMLTSDRARITAMINTETTMTTHTMRQIVRRIIGATHSGADATGLWALTRSDSGGPGAATGSVLVLVPASGSWDIDSSSQVVRRGCGCSAVLWRGQSQGGL